MTIQNVKSFTLSQAAKIVGKSKSVLHYAIKNGTLAAKKTSSGVFEITPADLFQLFPKQNNLCPNCLLLEQKIQLIELQLERELTLNRDLFRRLENEMQERSKLLDILSKVMPPH